MPSTPSDITLAVGDGARRMTYAELAQARAISLASASAHKSGGNCRFSYPWAGADHVP
jgi:hypothetical protein